MSVFISKTCPTRRPVDTPGRGPLFSQSLVGGTQKNKFQGPTFSSMVDSV